MHAAAALSPRSLAAAARGRREGPASRQRHSLRPPPCPCCRALLPCLPPSLPPPPSRICRARFHRSERGCAVRVRAPPSGGGGGRRRRSSWRASTWSRSTPPPTERRAARRGGGARGEGGPRKRPRRRAPACPLRRCLSEYDVRRRESSASARARARPPLRRDRLRLPTSERLTAHRAEGRPAGARTGTRVGIRSPSRGECPPGGAMA